MGHSTDFNWNRIDGTTRKDLSDDMLSFGTWSMARQYESCWGGLTGEYPIASSLPTASSLQPAMPEQAATWLAGGATAVLATSAVAVTCGRLC